MIRYWLYTIIATLFIITTGNEALPAQNLPIYELNVKVVPGKHVIKASARISIPEGVQSLLKTSALSIEKVFINDKEVDFKNSNSYALSAEKERKIVEIEYAADFASATLSEHADAMQAGAANSVSDDGVILLHDWYPTVTGPCLYKLKVEIPEAFEAVSESEGTGVTVHNGAKVISFEFPHPLSGITLVAAKYAVKSEGFHGITIKTFLFAEDSKLADTYIEHTKRYIGLYESLLGRFPYKTFTIVENRFQTGFSFPTYTLLGSQVIRLPFIVETSLGHEILHQWLGNSVFVSDAGGNWSEGLTTYLADHWYRHMQGGGADYRKKLLSDYMNYVAPEKEISLNAFTSPEDYATRAVGYGKSAMVFHMLRMKLGDDVFFKALREFVTVFSFQYASWDTLRECFSSTGGQDLKSFFTQWLNRKSAPSFSIEHEQVVFRENAFILSCDIVQNGDAFVCTLPAQVITEHGEESLNIDVTGAKTQYEKQFSSRPVKIILDAHYDTMRKLAESEMPPIISAFAGDTQGMVITPEHEEKLYSAAASYFKKQGYRVVPEKEVLFDDLGKTSIMFLSDRNGIYHKLFAGSTLPEGGCVIKVNKNPLNSKRVAIVIAARDKEELEPVYKKIFRYGNYSLLVFEKGRNRLEERSEAAQGISMDLGVSVSAIKTANTFQLDTVIRDIKNKKIIYIGESHTAYADHIMQLEIIRRLYQEQGRLIIGMEMFQRPFQKYLDQYIQKQISEGEFLKKTEYFSRWGFDYNLYRDILSFARAYGIPVIALNLRKEIIEKVAEKGLDSLSDKERAELPPDMDMNNETYRSYLQEIYSQHEQYQQKGFDYFYLSQLLWDETMAHSVAEALKKYPGSRMVVLAGSGHLQHAWGIPDRVKRLTGESGALILDDSGEGVDRSLADFILFPEPVPTPESPKLQVLLKKEKGSVVIEKVLKGGPAEKAGLKEEDSIRAIDAKPIQDINDIKILLLGKKKGDNIQISIARKQPDGKVQEVAIGVVL